MLFKNRAQGGRKLGDFLAQRHFENPIVIALPRGGVVTAAQVARALHCPMDLLVVRKIGAPGDEEYGIGAMSEDEECFFSPGADLFDVSADEVQEVIKAERLELQRRIKLYRNRELKTVRGHTVIVVDDGLATGVTATAAIKYLRKKGPLKIVFAVPVGPQMVGSYLKELCDEVIILERPPFFSGIGLAYEDFSQTSDEEVMRLLKEQ